MGLIDEHLHTCYPVIAGVSNTRSGPNSQLQLAISFHKTSPIHLHFHYIFHVIREESCNYDLLPVLLSFAVFFWISFIMRVMFKEIKLWSRIWKFFYYVKYAIIIAVCYNCSRLLWDIKCCPVLDEKKKKGVSSFLQLKIWKNLFKKMLAQEYASFVSIICSPEHNTFYQQYSVSYLINIKWSASLTWM